MLPLNHPMTGFEELFILNSPKNSRTAFTDFFLSPLHSLASILERTVIYSSTSRKKWNWEDLLRISPGRQCAFRSKHSHLGDFQTLWPITQISLTCLMWALLNSAIWGIQSVIDERCYGKLKQTSTWPLQTQTVTKFSPRSLGSSLWRYNLVTGGEFWASIGNSGTMSSNPGSPSSSELSDLLQPLCDSRTGK